MTKTLIYLATPYTHPDPVVVEWRFKKHPPAGPGRTRTRKKK